MKINLINNPPTLLNKFIAEMRDVNIQKDSLRFRKNIERLGEIFAYEISKTLTYKSEDIRTPLGIAQEFLPQEKMVITSILRAGIPFHNGILNFFDNAQNAFISAYRKHTDEGEFEIQIEYISAPDITEKIVILADPMLATGSSMYLAYEALKTKGKPKHIHIVSIIASQAGLEYIKNAINDENVTLWLGVIDEELNAKSYIVPGLGDAGDLAFGTKL